MAQGQDISTDPITGVSFDPGETLETVAPANPAGERTWNDAGVAVAKSSSPRDGFGLTDQERALLGDLGVMYAGQPLEQVTSTGFEGARQVVTAVGSGVSQTARAVGTVVRDVASAAAAVPKAVGQVVQGVGNAGAYLPLILFGALAVGALYLVRRST